MKLINERTMFKILLEGNGLMLSVTTKKRAFFVFLSSVYIGCKTAPTTDPHPGIVELCDYDIKTIIREWSRLYRVCLPNQPLTVGITS
ncbi:MAG: hypothetical protein JRN56_01885 [Nitrososphaerota archaeon]|jgi:hypothetical protein|nr:hypothetical protein [Nitrososphaerota archaeon]MDG6903794.1 hypothetical protein [Nitrososphaerota archaeon]MDG6911573.1 hypothetical protein [Nitrososphaerota archaeon]MDG6940477.1 hypothetical protein [Nitrososphaerota archaeon]MDG6960788.1 hypothetical protein [Nitrososphaerota archaeon]